jgi:hypothetical protein
MARCLTPPWALARALYESLEANAGIPTGFRDWKRASPDVRRAFIRDARRVLNTLVIDGFSLTPRPKRRKAKP